MKKLLLLIAILNLAIIFGGCSQKTVPDTKKATVFLNISAAASLIDVLTELKPVFEAKYPGYVLRYNFGSSGALQQQIEQGAPVDVFISAGKKQTDSLLAKGLINNPRAVAKNTLVIVGATDSAMNIASVKELSRAKFLKIAIGDPKIAPVGKYAQETLEKASIWTELSGRLVYAKDARQVLTYVETGNVDAGIVYESDALGSIKAKILLGVPQNFHSKIIYPAAAVKASQQSIMDENFLNFLTSIKSQDSFKKHGFVGN